MTCPEHTTAAQAPLSLGAVITFFYAQLSTGSDDDIKDSDRGSDASGESEQADISSPGHSSIQADISSHDEKLKDFLRQMCKPLFEFALVKFEEQVEQASSTLDTETVGGGQGNSTVIIKKALMEMVKSIISEEIKRFRSLATSTLQMALEELVVKMSKAAVFMFGIEFPEINDSTPDVPQYQEKVKHFFDELEKITFETPEKLMEDGVKSLILAAVTATTDSTLSKMAAGAAQKLALISKYESALSSKMTSMSEEAKKQMQKFMAVSKLRGILFSSVLNYASKYDMGQGHMRGVKLLSAAISRRPKDLARDQNQLEYLRAELIRIKEMTTTSQTWRDAAETWVSTLKLIAQIRSERGLAVLECIRADDKVTEALGAVMSMMKIDGELPSAVLTLLNEGPGHHIREHSFTYIQRLDKEIEVINSIKSYQGRLIGLAGAAITSFFIFIANVGGNFATKVLEKGGNNIWITVLIICASVIGLCLCISGLCMCMRWRSQANKLGHGAKYKRV